MNPQLFAAVVLALAVLLGSARALWLLRRQVAAERPRPWRIGVLLLAQAASAVLLYCVLFPPPVPREAGTLVVLTARAGEIPAGETPGERVVALPEAEADIRPGAERVPDLASALRRYPSTRRIQVVGAGLVPRDRDAVRGRAVDFHAAPSPPGLAEMQSPTRVPAGRRFAVSGRAERLDGGSAELRDPAGRRVARTALDEDGGFQLHASTRSAGLASYRLQLRDARGRVVDDVPVPLETTPARALEVLVLAGAPNPELKFLRRWALDAGNELDTRISLGAGLQIGTAPAAFNAATLDRLDLLILDDRSWRALGATRRVALAAAIDRGLGLLLRLAGPLTGADRERLATLGFTVTGEPAGETRLGGNLVGADDAIDALPPLTRNLHPAVADGIPLLTDAAGAPLGAWRAHGRGRVGVSTLVDSYRLVLAGRNDLHGEIWSSAFTTLARPVAAGAGITIDATPPHQRSVICGIGEGAEVTMPGGGSVALHIDPSTGANHCAGFWAEDGGWHRLHDGDRAMSFHVRVGDAATGVAAHALREATKALVAASAAADAPPGLDTPHAVQPGPRWPWFLAWLLLATTAWWFERSRRGLPRIPTIGA